MYLFRSIRKFKIFKKFLGALTLKSLAFYLRNWDTEKIESIDPTDGFGSNTRLYISNNQVVQIEPEYNSHTFNTWLTDKGRQFFDAVFKTPSKSIVKDESIKTVVNSWTDIAKKITQILYMYDHCNNQKSKKYFFTVVFDNLSVETVSFLLLMAQNYSFINLKKAENLNINNSIESNFQLNLTSNNKTKLVNSSICLLLSSNPRYEGYFLNLNLRKQLYKNNLKCFSIGSLINLTFPVTFLGSNLSILKTISEGKNLTCRNFKVSNNSLIVYNNELLKRSDGENIIETCKMLKYSNIFNKTWNNLNNFSSSLCETGTQSISKFSAVNKSDLASFSLLYFLNVNVNSIINLKQITEFKLLNLKFKASRIVKINKFFVDQTAEPLKNFKFHTDVCLSKVTSNQYFRLPISTFYENEETFITTEGIIKRTTKVIFRKKTKNSWQLLRKMFKHLKTNINFMENKINQLIFFNFKKISQFKNFIYFQYQATMYLVRLNFYLSLTNKSFTPFYRKFKLNVQKIVNTKLKYWLDDFYSGGKDEYTQNSIVLADCSKILRLHSTNFF